MSDDQTCPVEENAKPFLRFVRKLSGWTDVVTKTFIRQRPKRHIDNPMLSVLAGSNHGGMVSKSALVHVNFEKPHGTVTTKDAKFTFSDMLGTIGGTFGVFLGLSFVGVLDFFLILRTWIGEMYREFTSMVKPKNDAEK